MNTRSKLDSLIFEAVKDEKNLVISRGCEKAPLMIIGEAPGVEEEKLGLPFVGRSGKLLDKLLLEVGIRPQKDTYITNVVKIRPPNNRKPYRKEILKHLPLLLMQIEFLSPNLILAVGSIASEALLGLKFPLKEIRGRWHHFRGIPLMPIYHPAYLLRNPLKGEGMPLSLTLNDLYKVRVKLDTI